MANKDSYKDSYITVIAHQCIISYVYENCFVESFRRQLVAETASVQ